MTSSPSRGASSAAAARASCRGAVAAGLHAAPLRLERVEPDPRPVHPRAGPHRRRRPRRQAAVFAAAAGADAVPAHQCHARPGRARRPAATTARRPRCRRCAAPNGPAACRRRAARSLFAGFYCNELLMKLLARHDPHPRLFDAYADTLPALGAADDVAAQAALRAFELVLLREIGLLPDLSLVTATQSPVREGDRLYRLARARRHRAAVRRRRHRRRDAGPPAGRARPRQPGGPAPGLRRRRAAAAAQPAARPACLSSRHACAAHPAGDAEPAEPVAPPAPNRPSG